MNFSFFYLCKFDLFITILKTAAGKEDNFQLFACIYEASMIERKAGEKNVQFEMSIGLSDLKNHRFILYISNFITIYLKEKHH